MQVSDHLLKSFTITATFHIVFLLPLVSCSSHGEVVNNHKSITENEHKMSPQMTSFIAVHGLILWVSMGFLMPVGILTIRMANKEEGGRRVQVLFYLHAISQILAVLLATVGAVMSLKNFENSFNNNHQRLGLALYGAIWLQALIGFFRPPRGNKKRSTWYLTHWILGTAISMLGMVNIYTGLEAYRKKTSKSTGVWTMLFTAQVSFVAFFYLFQDKWEYMQKQAHSHQPTLPSDQENVIVITQRVLLPEPCGKSNALGNLFD